MTARSGDVPDSLSDPEQADRMFHALADRTRRDIVVRAARGDHSVSSLARHYPMTFAAVQRHVAVLERAGLVRKEPRGREQLVRTEAIALRQAHELLDRLEVQWLERFDRFSHELQEHNEDQ